MRSNMLRNWLLLPEFGSPTTSSARGQAGLWRHFADSAVRCRSLARGSEGTSNLDHSNRPLCLVGFRSRPHRHSGRVNKVELLF